MIKGLRGASIWSADLNNLLPFYRDTLGLPVALETPGFVVLSRDTNGAGLALGTHSEVRGKNGDPARHMVSLDSDDVQKEAARLKAAGVEFVEEATQFPNGWIATCKDPEGNYVQLIQFDQPA
jgi:predicted enzyme related to lactoylglutathione lyase